MIRRRLGAAALAATLTLTAAACSDPTASGGSGSKDTLNVYLHQKPKRFSPLDPPSLADQLVMQLVFDNLLTVDDKYQYAPRLAESWDVDKAAKTFTFHLRKGVKWSDGTPFTSKDVLFSYRLLADAKSGSAMAGKLAGVAGFTAPDPATFVVKLVKPNVGFLSLIAGPFMWVMPEHVLGKVPKAEIAGHAFFNKPTVGLGPYTFVQYKTDQYVEVAANPGFRTPVRVKKVFLKPVTSDVATAQLGTGEIDLVQISPTDLKSVQGMKNVTVEAKPSPSFVRIAVNQRQKRFADPRVRRAMLQAIDRQGLVDKLLAGKGSVQNTSFVTPWAVPKDLQTYPYDQAGAKRLLQEAGWDPAKPVTLTWIPGQRDRDAATTVIQSALRAVGVKVELKQVQSAELLASYEKGTFDMSLFGGGTYASDPSSSVPIISCAGFYPPGANIPHFCDKDIDGLAGAADASTDMAERTRLYQEAAKKDNAGVSYLWLYNADTIWAHGGRLHGFKANGDFTLGFWNAHEWSIAP
ncbi:ABC transporter substrate-binding protein [Actinomadura rubrisoli]|uniref:ABC transporter substrate-binding protein n=1 Tax=Actinomadura rubrisoli TaxID=2530368 RepID=A0A4R5CGP3_9ACTN|nr:ABC transporter substrate-binding protein [Actinomadura rubrisoli]TDD96422.1 ABC transporter substrate-binding protein [Actinomadura rubrisoli]